MTTAVGYLRLSHLDRKRGSTSTDDQKRALGRVAESLGVTVVEWIEDEDFSASRFATKARPGFDRLVSEVAPRTDVILIFAVDRYSRTVREIEDLRDLVRDHGKRVITADGIEHTPQSLLFHAMMAEAQPEATSVNLRRQRDAARARGVPTGRAAWGYRLVKRDEEPAGGPLPLGLGQGAVVGLTVDEEIAPIAREIMTRLENGQSSKSIARWLNEEARVSSPDGRKWWGTSVLAWARRPALCGRVTHRDKWRAEKRDGRGYRSGAEVLDEDGRPVEYVVWRDGREGAPPLIAPDQWERVIARVGSNVEAVGRPATRPGRASTLLYGLLRCAECGGPMPYHGSAYSCDKASDHGRSACPGNAISSAFVEEYVLSWCIERVSSALAEAAEAVEAAEREAGSDSAETAVRKAKARYDHRKRRTEQAVEDGADEDEVSALVDEERRAAQEWRAAKAAAGRRRAPREVRAMLDRFADAQWDRLGEEDRRAYLRATPEAVRDLIERVTVRRMPPLRPRDAGYYGRRGHPVTNPERVLGGIVPRGIG